MPNIRPVLVYSRNAGHTLMDAGDPADTVLVDGDRSVTYGELRRRAESLVAGLDLADRSLVAVRAAPTVEFVATYLGLMANGHVPLLAGDHAVELAEHWSADALVTFDGTSARAASRRRPTERALHPDLALLMSTSGSTGAPKLVRLSHANLTANATAIASILALRPTDRGITSLPLHYCYGLSVLHSHLAVGAGIVLSDASVVDPCFNAAVRVHRVTSLAGVPHTFEMLDHSRTDVADAPHLRLITQAGGRMAPAQVRSWAGRCAANGVDFVVMYGQTEATARMAYLPPELADERPEAIGRAIPGGSFELAPVAGEAPDVGELVYRGPNVMMGYATEPDDLAAGHTIDALFTGDLARRSPEPMVSTRSSGGAVGSSSPSA